MAESSKKNLGKMSGVRLPEEISLKIAVIASKEYEFAAEIMRRACEEFVTRWEKKNGAIPDTEIEKARAAIEKKK